MLRQSGHVIRVRDVNFSVSRGEIFVVMGLSGSGKSTALRTVNNVNKLFEATGGHVWVDGTDVQPSTAPYSKPSAARKWAWCSNTLLSSPTAT